MEREEIKAKVIEIIASKLNKDEDEITEEKEFERDLGADSLETSEIVMELEDTFEIDEIPQDDSLQIKTVGKAIDYLAEKL